MMRLAFMGTPDFAVTALSELVAAGHQVDVVYTRAPQPAGRGKQLRPSPVHAFAEKLGIEVRTPKNFKGQAEVERFRDGGFDLAVVVAYGVILPKAILEVPRLGCVNVHGSLLPRWRGAAPIQRAIMAGDAQTGVQIMQMEEGLDTGPILLSESTPIAKTDTAASLHDRLARIGADLLIRALAAMERDGLTATPQASQGVVYADKIQSAEARIDWGRPADALDCHIRGLAPFPGAWFEIPGPKGPVRVKALLSQSVAGEGAPGTVLESDEVLRIACGEGAIQLLKLQRAGKSVQDATSFLRGNGLPVGTVLE